MTVKRLDDLFDPSDSATPTDTPEGLALLAFLRGVPLRDAIAGNGTTLEDLEEPIREAFRRAMDAGAEVQRLRTMLIALGSHGQGIAAMSHVTVRPGEGLRVIVTSATTDERWLAGQLRDDLARLGAALVEQLRGRGPTERQVADAIDALAHGREHALASPAGALEGVEGPATITELRMVRTDAGKPTGLAEAVCVVRMTAEDARRMPLYGHAWLTLGGRAVVSTDPTDAP